ncbi:MAG TPA: hypothetical protein DCM28_09490 [Phycisphaerales bacterium]|nr:hypothetical protein [Phycisphaerales bacterium]HCD34882.1 hypothetical protein [Phycisphaerales bacterium]|tara:strand:- start:383 stop:1483 length:1101 start_codon:yes stop_codon:yes gene_type:complete
MSQYKIQPIDKDDLPQLADFLHESIENFRDENPYGSGGGQGRSRDTIFESLQRSFKHQTQIDPTGQFGLKLCDDNTICGSLLFFPQIYRFQNQTYRALGSGSFFVDPNARMQGFFMFRKYLASKNYDFYFGNTCNTNSIALWKNCKGVVVPNSDIEYLIILKPAAVFEELVLRKNKPWLSPVARTAGLLAGCLTRWRRDIGLKVSTAESHQQLAQIADEVCPLDLMTADRSVDYLQWHYPDLNSQSKNNQPQVFVFSDQNGPQGWFAIDYGQRGLRQQINAARILDVVWARKQYSFKQILHVIASTLDKPTDLLSIRARPDITLDAKFPHAYQRQLPAPESAVLSKSDIGSEQLNMIVSFATVDAV